MSADRSSQVAQSADGASNAIDQDNLLNTTAAAIIEPEQASSARSARETFLTVTLTPYRF